MKQKHRVSSLLLTTLVSGLMAYASPSQIPPAGSSLQLNTDKPAAGQHITFDYTASGGKLTGTTDIHAALIYYTATRGSSYYAEDCTIQHLKEDNWQGEFTLPDSAIAFALRLKSGKIIENNNGLGYISLVYTGTQPRPGAYAGAALLYSNGGSLLNLPNRADTALTLLEKEFSLHPESRPTYEAAWYYNLVTVKKQEAYPLLDRRASELTSAPQATAADYTLAIRLYRLQKKKPAADSVLAIAAGKFPASELAVQYAENQFYQIRDLDSLQIFYTQFKQRFPIPAETSSYFASTIGTKFIQKKEYRKAIGYISQMADIMADYRGYLYNWVALELIKSDSALQLADSLVHLAIADLNEELAHPEKFRKPGIPLTDWKTDINKYYYAAFADTYAKLLVQKGEWQKAIEEQALSVKLASGENNGFNEHYVKYLLKAGALAKAKEVSAGFIRTNNASDSVKTWFHDAYIKEKGSDQGYDKYLAELEDAGKQRFRTEAIKEKLDLASKPFTLQDIDGKDVSLASLKGKVVVVDFWATWCGPCKASFPAMQTAVDKYKQDTNVVFLFIDTWESTPADKRLAEVRQFIRDNHYTFHVLLDKVVDLEKRQYSMVSEYEVGGIPTKFVLSPDGKIAFKAVGFDGNNDKLLTELSVYIELARG